ncbi:saccharopine dehydrogenase [Candidatus Poribacteria bacterium]|nr:saccharopine dehydrogenase [Candidatus Poribacteria bacterium]
MLPTDGAVLIVGGYGVVGKQVCEFLRARHPALPLLIAGRNPTKAETLAENLGNAQVARVNVEHPGTLAGFDGRLRGVVAVVNDPQDYLLIDAVRAGLPFVDITRWTARLRHSLQLVSDEVLSAPVMFASSWMAGVAAITAVAAARKLERVDSVDINILYSMKDKAGPNSVEYMDRLSIPYNVMINGREQSVYPLTDPRKVTFPSGHRAKVYRFDTPDQITLPRITGAKTVAARMAFDSSFATKSLVALVRSGIWKMLAGDSFTGLRRSLLYNPGEGGSHEIVVELEGVDENGNSKLVRAMIVDPNGQTHLTALGATMNVERLLGLDGAAAPPPRVLFPDSGPNWESVSQLLRDSGVFVNIE